MPTEFEVHFTREPCGYPVRRTHLMIRHFGASMLEVGKFFKHHDRRPFKRPISPQVDLVICRAFWDNNINEQAEGSMCNQGRVPCCDKAGQSLNIDTLGSVELSTRW